mmetsp:Transcript_8352/g.21921  ORF Transcript_8352/g.21921 Transcript_8352/m.21921 type:complete len:200 (-) Transcript_8352:396-995(-)
MRILPPAESLTVSMISSSRFDFSCSATTSTFWVMFLLAARSSVPWRTWTGSLPRNSLAMATTSLGQVAVNMRVWRSGRIWETMERSWGSKPMSSMRSASSRTRYVTRLRFVFPDSRKSMSLPGVAMQISTPRSRSRIWGPLGTPPYTQVFLMRDVQPNFVHSAWIWTASSRVGASTRTMGPSPRSRYGWALMWTMPGRM